MAVTLDCGALSVEQGGAALRAWREGVTDVKGLGAKSRVSGWIAGVGAGR